MKTRGMRIWFVLLIMVVLATCTIWPVAAREAQPEAAGQSVMLRLKFAVFDPLQGEPPMPPTLHTETHRGTGEGAYIVQFKGPIQGAWIDQVRALGGRVMDYLPDFSYLVWMDGAVQKQVAALGTVRWVGLYQPAYKLSPNLDRTKPIYRVVLFEGADLGAVAARLAGLNTPTRQIAGEQFALFLPEGGIDQVANWPEVLWIENRPLFHLHNDVATGIMGAPTAWGNGFTGLDQKVTVADSGIDTGTDAPGVVDMHADFDDRFKTTPAAESEIKSYAVDIDWAGCASNVGADDGPADLDSGHGTHVLGSVLGDGDASGGAIKGTAHQAKPTFQAVEQWTTWTGPCAGWTDGYELTGLPLDLYPFFQDAYDWGSRIHSNSWGGTVDGAYGVYSAYSQDVDRFVWDHPDMLILFSAGNGGTDKKSLFGYVDEGSLDAPGTAKNALTVGASDNSRLSGGLNPGSFWCYTWGTCWSSDFQHSPTSLDRISDDMGELAAFSGRGPTEDERRKPDVVAPGTNIVSARSSVASGTGWGVYNDYYLYMGGTSMATPLVAGAAALVREYYVDGGHVPSAALLKATLINSAVEIPGYLNTSQEAGLPIPNNHEGWGRVDVGAATAGDRQFVDGVSVGHDQTNTYFFDVNYSTSPFKVTLVWSDYPATLSASPALVNDLDLEVVAPGGATTYRGNVFSGGRSVPGGSADRVNNVESVYIPDPALGQWTVRVHGFQVPEPVGTPQQPFALAATIPAPPPVADFSASPTSGPLPLEVSFTDLSTGEITGWEWDFGDTLGSSLEQHPTYTYQDAGDYTVSLTVTGPGGSDIETKTGYIQVTDPPSLHVDHAVGAPGSYFVFTGQNFASGEQATISVNGTDLAPTVLVGGTGGLEFALHTAPTMSPGGYFVTARTGSGASAYFDLDPDATEWPNPGVETTIDVPDTIAPAPSVYLPLVMRGYSPVSADPLQNGDFEAGPVDWSQHSELGWDLIVNSGFPDDVTPHSGSWLAWFGTDDEETAHIEQVVTILTDAPYLHYWHWIISTEYFDEATVRVDGTPVETVELSIFTNTGGWLERSVDLGAYAGQSIALKFQIQTGLDNYSTWFVDDVSFQATPFDPASNPSVAVPGISGPISVVRPPEQRRQP